jgi:hypothetical protein
MTHREYVDACHRTELKDMPARILNVTTGEIGTVQQCVGLEIPEAMLVKVDGKLTTWWLDEVKDISEEL